MISARVGVAFLLAILLSVVDAAERQLPSTVNAVTLYPDRVIVSRVAEADLDAGAHVVILEGLPAQLLTETLRVEEQGGMVIGGVETKRVFATALVRDQERRLTAELERLKDESQVFGNNIQALNDQLVFIRALGAKTAEHATERFSDGKMDPSAWRQAWSVVGQGSAETLAAMQKETMAKRDLDQRISQKERELGAIRTGTRESIEVILQMRAARAAHAKIVVHYEVGGAGWQPLYDVRLDTGQATAVLAQRARVRQSTGEDWRDVDLILSTAQPGRETQPPPISPWFIDFEQPVIQQRSKALSLSEAADQALPAAAPEGVEVVVGEFAAEYRIPGKVSVPADGEPHSYTVAEYPMDTQLTVRTVPRLRPQAYLYAALRYRGPDPLLPGPLHLFRDGAYVGQDTLPMLHPGEAVSLGYGVDDNVTVKYALVTGERSRSGMFTKMRRVERRYRIEVQNFHGQPMEITALDQLPVAADTRIQVERLADGTLPTATDVEGNKGVLAWTRIFAPKESSTIEFGYAVNFPEDRQVPGF